MSARALHGRSGQDGGHWHRDTPEGTFMWSSRRAMPLIVASMALLMLLLVSDAVSQPSFPPPPRRAASSLTWRR